MVNGPIGQIVDMHAHIIIHPDCEGNTNQGFRQDILELHVNERPAGYFKTSWVPFNRILTQLSPEVAEVALRYGAGLARTDVNGFLDMGMRVSHRHDMSVQEYLDLTKGLKEDFRNVLRDVQYSFENVDRPLPDFVRLYVRDEIPSVLPPYRFHGCEVKEGPPSTIDYAGRGLGRLLYRETARWLARSGYLLHIGDLASSTAKVLHKGLREDLPEEAMGDWSSKNGKLGWLDGRFIEPWLPRGVSDLEVTVMPAGRPAERDNWRDLPDSPHKAEWLEREAHIVAQGMRHPLGGERCPEAKEYRALMAAQGWITTPKRRR